jgi:hypothetical protein
MSIFKREPKPRESLICQCGHGKCYHYDGRRACFEEIRRDGYFTGLCACQTFLPVPAEPTVSELEEWARKKVHGNG